MHEEQYDDVVDTLKETGSVIEKFFSASGDAKDTVKNKLSLRKEKKNEKKALRNKSPEMIDKVKTDFIFTGQATDLRYFEDASAMPISLIENIKDPELREAVKDEMNKAIAEGNLKISNGRLTITESGKKYISKPSFQKAADKDLKEIAMVQEVKLGMELNGTMQDLAFFQYNSQLNLSELMINGDYEAVSKIMDNFNKMSEGGLVQIENGVATLTDKGKKALENPAMKGIKEKEIGSALAQTSGTVFMITRKIAKSLSSSERQR